MRGRILPAGVLAALLLGTISPCRGRVEAGRPRRARRPARRHRPQRLCLPGGSFAEQNPPESWILLMQYANLPLNQPVAVKTPALGQVLCGLLWEEVRPVRKVMLSWTVDQLIRPSPDELVLIYFDATDATAHTWWNPRTIKEAGKPEVSPDGRTFTYAIPVDTWGVVASIRGPNPASHFACPKIRALVPDVWKRVEIEIEWAFDPATARLDHEGSLETYDGIVADLRPLSGDTTTVMTGPSSWRSPGSSDGRHGLRLGRALHGRLSLAKSLALSCGARGSRADPSDVSDAGGRLLISSLRPGAGADPGA